jgi:hypothetical protein
LGGFGIKNNNLVLIVKIVLICFGDWLYTEKGDKTDDRPF